ncbi:hypothetical protein [Streptomyces cinereoruber]|uniref:hypothetical protein n=1 Tax=Streptomyces cinereoruber TaxID=67260 RepID=UPI00345D9140
MTPHELWTALPQDARERVDAFVVRRKRIMAVKEMWESGAVLPDPPGRPRPLARWQQADWTEPLATARALADRLGVPLRGPGDDGPPYAGAE